MNVAGRFFSKKKCPAQAEERHRTRFSVMAHEISGWCRKSRNEQMAGCQRVAEGREEERLAPSSAAVWCQIAPERLETTICSNGVTQEVIDHFSEMVQELRPHTALSPSKTPRRSSTVRSLGTAMA